ncbi:MAG: gephyrin-like molybdotransferase Glp [Microcystaceae cyanobacterium]
MLPVSQAEARILDLINPLQTLETVTLREANRRILGETVVSGQDFPYWPNSAMDGYAVQWQDVAQASPDQPVSLTIIEEIPAGQEPQRILNTGQAARIFTGAKLLQGADTVVMQEQTQRQGDQVLILSAPPKKGHFVRSPGEYCQKGGRLLTAGMRLQAPELAVLATAQVRQVPVYRRPQVAIFSTGDELISVEETLTGAKIVDSNQYALAAFVENQGAIPVHLGIVPDDPDRLKHTMAQAIASADLVLSTGGVSVGDHDYVEKLLAELGGEIVIRSVPMKPGKPLTVAKFANGCVYFGIPGNPVSALVSCWRFVQPAIAKLSGLAAPWSPVWVKAQTQTSLTSDGQRETYLWGRVQFSATGDLTFQIAPGSHSSGNLINLAQANALAVLPIGTTAIAPLATVHLLLPQGL